MTDYLVSFVSMLDTMKDSILGVVETIGVHRD